MSDKSDYKTELAEFRAALRGVKSIDQNRANLSQSKTQAKDPSVAYRREKAQESSELIVDGLSTSQDKFLDPEETVLFALPGVQLRLIKRMKAGHLGWDAGLDLHGFSTDHAREELYQFMQSCQRQGLRSLIIIHGKAYTEPGKPALLKTYVTDWLRQMDNVLAFCSAQPQDGGSGALYVLLKRQRDQTRLP